MVHSENHVIFSTEKQRNKENHFNFISGLVRCVSLSANFHIIIVSIICFHLFLYTYFVFISSSLLTFHFIASQCVKLYSIVHNFLHIISTEWINSSQEEVKQAADIPMPLHNFGISLVYSVTLYSCQWITTSSKYFCCSFFFLLH